MFLIRPTSISSIIIRKYRGENSLSPPINSIQIHLSSSPGISLKNWEQNGVRFSEGEARRRHQPPWRSVSETSARKLKLTVKKRSQSIYNFRIILLNILCYFTFQEPPLSGPSISIIPSAFSFARCFSTAFAVTPISAARSCQLAIFRKKSDDFLPTFSGFLTTF